MEDGVAVGGEQGLHLLGQGIHFVVGVGTEQVVEDCCGTFQQLAGAWQHNVFKGGGLGAFHDALYGSILLLHAFEHGFLEMGDLQTVKGNGAVWGTVGYL